MINGILMMATYGFVSIVSYLLIKQNYILYLSETNLGKQKANKLRIASIFAISSLYTILNWFATKILSNNTLGSDRLNYSIEFSGVRSVQSPGLQFIFDIVKKCGGDIYSVFYLTTFITVFITLIAYRRSKLASPKLITLLLVSEYVFFSFTGLKQSYAAAFSFLFFVNAIENKTKKGTMLCLFDIVLSILFHSSGYILIPLLVILRIDRNNKKRLYFLILISIMCLIFLPNIMQFVSARLGSFLPILSYKIDNYFGNFSGGLDSQWSAIIKYFPFIYISIWGVLNRKRLMYEIEEYDLLLLVSVIGSLIVLYSIYSYWFQRFRYSFSFPVFLLYDLIDRNESLKGNKIINDSVVVGGTLFVTARKILLIFKNFGTF
ncbi:MAG: EpsG family protein [Acetivibrio ethanolgignens]